MSFFVNQTKISINLDYFVKQYFINPGFEYLLAAVDKSKQESIVAELLQIAEFNKNRAKEVNV